MHHQSPPEEREKKTMSIRHTLRDLYDGATLALGYYIDGTDIELIERRDRRLAWPTYGPTARPIAERVVITILWAVAAAAILTGLAFLVF